MERNWYNLFPRPVLSKKGKKHTTKTENPGAAELTGVVMFIVLERERERERERESGGCSNIPL